MTWIDKALEQEAVTYKAITSATYNDKKFLSMELKLDDNIQPVTDEELNIFMDEFVRNLKYNNINLCNDFDIIYRDSFYVYFATLDGFINNLRNILLMYPNKTFYMNGLYKTKNNYNVLLSER